MDALALQLGAEASRRSGRMAALGCSRRDLLGFFLGAAATAACVVLLQPAAPPCSYGYGPVAPEDYQELEALGRNGTAHAAPSPCSLVTPAAGQHQELATLGNGTAHPEPCTTKPSGMAAASPDDDNLPELLRMAAMDDKTVILTLTNEAFSAPGSLLDLFLHSFRAGVRTAPLLRHLVIVAADAKAYERCRRVHRLCYHLRANGTAADYSAELPFMKRNYLDMMWRRNRFQARVLALGYSFVFTDVDIVWLRNPLLRVPVGADLAMSCDKFYGDNPYDLDKKANGGFVYARASARTAAFYEAWYEAGRARPGKNEQDVFDELKRELAARHGVAAQFVDTAYLGGFCDRRKGRDFNKLCTYHGNCLVGMKTKLRKLTRVFAEWNKFRTKAKLTD
ncbi:unnamed protein product [Urochloa decumbens]|uniref:Nucleotide-diphospho-sugar transferase domain-containing protein n=1 Tax=Urochloa decumbens TaxID=240449 RepID=A0ABC9EVY7_9POAL